MSILSCVFLFALDNTIVSDVQPAIVNEFGDLAMLPWLSVAFMLGAASTLLIWYLAGPTPESPDSHVNIFLGVRHMASLTTNGFILSPLPSLRLVPRCVVLHRWAYYLWPWRRRYVPGCDDHPVNAHHAHGTANVSWHGGSDLGSRHSVSGTYTDIIILISVMPIC